MRSRRGSSGGEHRRGSRHGRRRARAGGRSRAGGAAADRRAGPVRRTRDDPSRVNPIVLLLAFFLPCRQWSPGWPAERPSSSRRRSSPSCGRLMRRVLALPPDGRASRHRRPRLAHDGRRRRPLAHHPLRGAGDADRRRHDAAHARRRALVDPLAALPSITGVPILWAGTRWYLRRAPAGYLWERASYATMTGTVGETVDGGRTVDALGLGEERVRRVDADLDDAFAPSGARSTCAPSGFPRPSSPTCCPWLRRSPGAAGCSRRPRLARRRDRGRALRPAARRPGRPAHLLAGRDPGRRDVLRAARRGLRTCRTDRLADR